jgi:hypothetical protein
MVIGSLPIFGKRFDLWPKSHLGLDALSNLKILKGVYWYMYQKQVIASFSDHSYGSIGPSQFALSSKLASLLSK